MGLRMGCGERGVVLGVVVFGGGDGEPLLGFGEGEGGLGEGGFGGEGAEWGVWGWVCGGTGFGAGGRGGEGEGGEGFGGWGWGGGRGCVLDGGKGRRRGCWLGRG